MPQQVRAGSAPDARTPATGGRAAATDALWALACAAVVSGALFAGGGVWEHVGNGDLHAAHLPWYQYVARAVLGDGRLPLWDRHLFCGTPVLANAQTCALYPPVLILFRVLGAWAALQSLYAVHAFVLAWGMIAYLRGEGIPRPAAAAGALLAAAVVFRGPLVTGVDHPSLLACAAWLPLMLVAWRHAARDGDARWLAVLALAVAVQWVAGYPEFTLDTAVLLVPVVLAAKDGPPVRRLATLVAGFALGTALAGLQLVPLQEAIAESPRVDPSFPWAGFRQMFAVHSAAELGWTLWWRYGLPALALAAVALRRPDRLWLGWLAAWVWTLFPLNPPFRWLYLLPPYSGLRFPFGWAGVSGVFLGCLAAAGLAVLWRAERRPFRVAAVVLGGLTLAHALVVIVRAPTSPPAFRPQAPGFRAPDLRWADERIAVLRGLVTAQERVLAEREADYGAAVLAGLPMPNGHEPSLPPRRIVQLLDDVKLYDGMGLYWRRDWAELAKRPDLGALLGLGFVVAPATGADALRAAGFRHVRALPPDEVVLHRPAIPRVRIVHRIVEGRGEDETHALVLAHVAASGAVVEAGAVGAPLAEPPAGAVEGARIVGDAPERVEVRAELASPGLLVLTDTYYPGWHVTVDGAPAALLRADHAFRGVRLDAGTHRVVFVYAPWTVRLGAVASGAAALVALGCLLRGRRSRG